MEFSTFVAGRPRPKGSLEGVASGRVRESNKSSAAWRVHVAKSCRLLAGAVSWPTLDVPTVVTLRFLFDRPADPLWPVPATTDTGDTDKLVRNVLDALSACDRRCAKSRRRCDKHAAIYRDDALVVDFGDVKTRYAKPWGMAGVFLIVRPLDLETEI